MLCPVFMCSAATYMKGLYFCLLMLGKAVCQLEEAKMGLFFIYTVVNDYLIYIEILISDNNFQYRSITFLYDTYGTEKLTGLVLCFGFVFVKQIIINCNGLCCCSPDVVFIEGDKDQVFFFFS